MRKAFIKSLVELAAQDKRIYLLTADMGYGLVEPFSSKYHDRFINVGVSEQNMIGVAAGLALSGKIVFVYSITNFPTIRCLEQIRNDVCYHNAKVHVVAGSTGLTYGALGSSHHATEDIAVMRALPNMTVICPSSPNEVSLATQAIYGHDSPCYLRLGNSPIKSECESLKFKIGKAVLLNKGTDVVLIATGSMVNTAMKAAEKLKDYVSLSVVNMSTVKPIDESVIVNLANKASLIVTIEEHSVIGGLGSAVAEVISEKSNVALKRLGIPDCFCTKVSSQEELLSDFGLTPDGIASHVRRWLNV